MSSWLCCISCYRSPQLHGLGPRTRFGHSLTGLSQRRTLIDLSAVRDLLWDSARFLWVTRGTPIWGREAGLKRFEALYQGTWRLEANAAELRVTMLSNDVAQLYVPIVFTIGPPGQPAQTTRFLMNQTIIKTPAGWKVASILPIPVSVQAAGIP
jgi:hypothetical protein